MSAATVVVRWEDSGGGMVVSAADFDALVAEIQRLRDAQAAYEQALLNARPYVAWVMGETDGLDGTNAEEVLRRIDAALDGTPSEDA
jgi:hypothetical protein